MAPRPSHSGSGSSDGSGSNVGDPDKHDSGNAWKSTVPVPANLATTSPRAVTFDAADVSTDTLSNARGNNEDAIVKLDYTVIPRISQQPASIHQSQQGSSVHSVITAIAICLALAGLAVAGVFVKRRRQSGRVFTLDEADDDLSLTPVEAQQSHATRHAAMSSPWLDRDLFMGEATQSIRSGPSSRDSNMSDSMSVSSLGNASRCSTPCTPPPARQVMLPYATEATSDSGMLDDLQSPSSLQNELRAELERMLATMCNSSDTYYAQAPHARRRSRGDATEQEF